MAVRLPPGGPLEHSCRSKALDAGQHLLGATATKRCCREPLQRRHHMRVERRLQHPAALLARLRRDVHFAVAGGGAAGIRVKRWEWGCQR